MPIIGLTDRGLSFPEIGQIRKGAPKNEKGQVGQDLKYFRVEFDEREVESQNTFLSSYGPEPQSLNILLPFNDIDQMWDAYLEAYTAGRMVARSDGEKFIYLVDTKSGEIVIKNGEPYREYKDDEPVGSYTTEKGGVKNIYCKPVGRLKVVIPELKRYAYMTVMTTSVHDIANISAQLKAIHSVNDGRIAGVPLVLSRVPREISVPTQDGKRVRMTKYILSIEAAPKWVAASIAESQRLAMPDIIDVPALPAGETVKEVHEEENGFEPPSQTEADFNPLGQLPLVKDDGRAWSIAVLDALVNAKKAQARPHAANMLGHSNLPETCTVDQAIKWATAYLGYRDNNLSVEAAAEKANA